MWKYIFYSIILLFFSCKGRKDTEQKNDFLLRENPANILWNYKLTVTKMGKKSYRLWTKRAEIYSIRKKFLCLDSVIITFFDKTTGVASHWIHSRDAEWIQGSNNFKAMGGTIVKNSNGWNLETDTLYYEHRKDRIYSHSRIKYYNDTDTLFGSNFASNSDLSRIKIYQSRGRSHRK